MNDVFMNTTGAEPPATWEEHYGQAMRLVDAADTTPAPTMMLGLLVAATVHMSGAVVQYLRNSDDTCPVPSMPEGLAEWVRRRRELEQARTVADEEEFAIRHGCSPAEYLAGLRPDAAVAASGMTLGRRDNGDDAVAADWVTWPAFSAPEFVSGPAAAVTRGSGGCGLPAVLSRLSSCGDSTHAAAPRSCPWLRLSRWPSLFRGSGRNVGVVGGRVPVMVTAPEVS